MLSRNAERVYWLGRYIERAEDTARLLKAFTQVMLDIPKAKKISWKMLLQILLSEHEFNKLYDEVNEQNVISFLLNDLENPSSIRSSVRAARENARTSRDIIPLEGWEILNDLNLLVKNSAEKTIHRKERYKYLSKIISSAQQFNGMIQSSLSRNKAYEFLRIGCLLERADMTTRLLDVAAGVLLRRNTDVASLDALIWLEILKAQNGILMYRALNGPVIVPAKVLSFILHKEDFPRSIESCLREINNYFLSLPDNKQCCKTYKDLSKHLHIFDSNKDIDPEFLHGFFDEIQKGLISMHNDIAATWFPKFREVTEISPEKKQENKNPDETKLESSQTQKQSQA